MILKRSGGIILHYKIGIDVGSTTLKTVILNEKNEIIEKSYQRHFSKVREMTLNHFKSLKEILKGKMGAPKAAIVFHIEEVYTLKSGPNAGKRID